MATRSFASEFDLSRFPAASEAEGRFRAAILSAEADPAGAATVFRTFVGSPEIPQDAVFYALAKYGDPSQTGGELEKLVALGRQTPFFREALLLLASRREKEGDVKGAEGLYSNLFDTASGEWEKGLALGRLLKLQETAGDEAGARKTALRLFLDFPTRPEAAQAEAFLSKAGKNPFEGLARPALLERGRSLVEGGSREKAVATLYYLKKSGKDYAASPALDLPLGKALHFLRRYDEALPPLTEAAKRSKDPETIQSATFWRARTLFGLDRGNEGAPLLVKLARRYPGAKKAPAWLYQALRVFEGRSMAKEAAEARSLLLKGYPGSEEAAELGFSQGWILYKEGKYKEAAASFERFTQGGKKGWLNSRALYWAFRAHARAGEAAKAKKVGAKLKKEYPFGYYSRACEASPESENGGGWVADPRGKGSYELKVRLPGPGDLSPADPDLAGGARYLRLGFPKIAAAMLKNEPSAAWLRYWAEDFDGALTASGGGWEEWPGDAEAPGGLFYPVAYPASVMKAAAESDIHPNFLLAIAHTESHFDPTAYSAWEARGLTQFIPDTARRTAKALGIDNWRDDMLYDPQVALRLGARHLRELLDRFDGDAASAAAAYNAGEAAVAKWRAKCGDVDPARFVEEIPYQETRKYVKKVLTAVDAYDRLGGDGGLWPSSKKN